jgi:ribonuclease E
VLPPIEPHPDHGANRSAVADAESDESVTTPSESARRRSTVREPAFATGSEAPDNGPPSLGSAAVGSEPVVSTPEESKTDERPRRSGWWSKRLLGR